MRLSPTAVLVTLSFTTAAAATCWLWLDTGAGRPTELRDPFPASAIPKFHAALPGELAQGRGRPAGEVAGSWPRFRGLAGDGVSREDVKLADAWPEGGPTRRWSISVGEGYAGPAVHRGRVYLLDYDEGRVEGTVVPERRGDSLRCLSLDDGEEIWRRWYHLPMVRYHGISRTVPAVTDRHVVSLGPMGHVLCVDAVTGEARWSLDLVEEFGTVIPEWYAGQCPRIDLIGGEEAAVIAPGGDRGVLMLAIACASGQVLWRTPNPDVLHMTHASIARMEWRGRGTYVCCTTGGVVGVAADDGRELWRYPEWKIAPAIVPTPVILDENRIFLSGGYKAGSRILEIREDADRNPVVATVASLDVRTFGAEQQTPVYHGDRLYGVLTRDAGPRREQLTCLSPEGAVLWSSGPERLFGLGPFLVAGGRLLLLDDNGTLTMIRPSGTAYEELARAKVLDGPECWGPMAFADGRLLVRDLHVLACLDLREGRGK